jgi:hypothetical protein
MLARGLLFSFWCLVLWGTIWDLALAHLAWSEGFSAAMANALRVPSDDAAWAWGNRLCGLVAVFTWVVVAGWRWAFSRRAE